MRTGSLLDWAVMAISLFNTVVLLWLGLTVLLNAERRTWGIWLSGSGLLMGGVFFLSHSIILGYGLDHFSQGVNFWWRAGWIPVVLAPCAWYVAMLWYAGFWEPGSTVYRRHRIGFTLMVAMTATLSILLVFARTLPSFTQMTSLNLAATPSILGAPLLILLYPPYILACIGLSLDALLRPGPTIRIMGQLARRRARPWLAGAAAILILVSLLVGGIMLWIVLNAGLRTYDVHLANAVALADLLIETLIALAVILTGQAIVSYEVFTGKALPRSGLKRYWRRALILALGYGLLISLSLALGLLPIYSLMLSTCLMVAFYALLGWRSYVERQRLISSLRPFVAGGQFYTGLLTPASDSTDLSDPFRALCENILGARLAYLAPLGSFAPLFDGILSYPPGAIPSQPDLSDVDLPLDSRQELYLALDPEKHAGATWGVPLWNERGLAGLLALAEKRDGGLYTQEEIEFARTAAERLIDMQASAEIGRRLMTLQRRQLVESQVLDRQTRRVLHDDILPRLHTAMLLVDQNTAASPEQTQDILHLLSAVHHDIADLLREMPAASAPEVARHGLLGALRQVSDNELKGAFDQVDWQVTPEDEQIIDHLPPLAGEVMFYAAREAMRNAARHAGTRRNQQALHLSVSLRCQDGLEIIIEDNGPGTAQPESGPGGSGQGLALHSTMLAVLGGWLSLESSPGSLTRVHLYLPGESIHSIFDKSLAEDIP